MGLIDRFKKAWNAFSTTRDPPPSYDIGMQSSYRPDRPRLTKGNDRSIVVSIYNRIALDCSSIRVEHVRLDDSRRYLSTIESNINYCLTVQANKDQTSREFIQDIVMSMLDEGSVAIVPVDTDIDITNSDSFDILSMRTGKILEWFPDHVRVRVYNDRTGQKEDLLLPKASVAIVENPFYAVMNEPSSTMQRLIRKLNLLDAIDEQTGSNKLNMIIQLPYIIKSEARKKQAEERRKEIESQLAESKYGIAYTDGTEHITQLNRSLENNLMEQIKYLTDMLYSQLGITDTILNGTADDTAMVNYNSRIIEPIMSSIVQSMYCKFLTRTARTQRQSFMYFVEPFKLVTANQIADVADKFTRNEIMTSNEIRQLVGFKPSSDPDADVLRNKNLNKSNEEMKEETTSTKFKTIDKVTGENQNG